MMAQIGDPDERVVRVMPEHVSFTALMWLTSHREVRTSRRVRVVFDILAKRLAARTNHGHYAKAEAVEPGSCPRWTRSPRCLVRNTPTLARNRLLFFCPFRDKENELVRKKGCWRQGWQTSADIGLAGPIQPPI